jgi:uncharacterized protein YkwD
MIRIVLLTALTLVSVPSLAAANDSADCLESHNHVRKAMKLAPLRLDKRLSEAAQRHADYMAKNRKLDHRGQDDEMYFHRARAAGYPTDWANSSENIAEGPAEFMDAAFATQAWLDSTVGHRDNVLSRDWRDVGFGMAEGSDGRRYWCAVYGRTTTSPRTLEKPLVFER